MLEHEGEKVYGFKHFGLYAFKPEALKIYERGSLSELEKVESLEQLRLLDAGMRIAVNVVDVALTINAVEVDTEADLLKARAFAG